METKEFRKKAQELGQDIRINSAFNCLYEQFQKGHIAKAFDYFSNAVKSEIDLSREADIDLLNSIPELTHLQTTPEGRFDMAINNVTQQNNIILNNVEACSE